MKITLLRAEEVDKSVLRNLMELYLYDFTEFVEADVNLHGLFEYPFLDHYWTDKEYHPFFIYAAKSLAGFALVRALAAKNGEPNHYMEEFFILKRFRGKGAGRKAAFEIFKRFPGRWYVGEIPENKPAIAFWRKVIKEYTRGNYTETSQTRVGRPAAIIPCRSGSTDKR